MLKSCWVCGAKTGFPCQDDRGEPAVFVHAGRLHPTSSMVASHLRWEAKELIEASNRMDLSDPMFAQNRAIGGYLFMLADRM